MATNDNTSDSARPPVPTFPSPKPGDHRLVTWPEYLELMGETIAILANPPQGTSGAMTPGRFVGTYLIGLSRQARIWGCTSPDDHLAKAAAAADREAAYVASLEQAAECGGSWVLGPPQDIGPKPGQYDDTDLGGYGGHPDEATIQAHIAIDPQAETWRN